MHKKVYAVTGAAGFIGSHIVEELLSRENVHVVGIDNFYSGKRENIAFLENVSRNNFTFVEADIANFEYLSEIFAKYGVEYVFHQAAVASVQKSIEAPRFTHEVNVRGTLNVLEASRINNVKKVLFASSAAVYGDEPTLPKNEASVIKPISPYGSEKYMGEQYLKLYAELYGLQAVALRYFNVYGPRQDPSSEYSGVISIFEDRIKNDLPVTIYGDGEQYRDFVYVKDVVKANISAMEKDTGAFDIFCVGTARKTSINNVFDAITKKYSSDIKASYDDVRDGDIKESLADNRKLVKVLDVQVDRLLSECIYDI